MKKNIVWPQVGNETAINFLKASIERDDIAPAYIFQGPKSVGKFKIAKFFASQLIFKGVEQKGDNLEIGSSGDLQILSLLEGKQNISITQVREFNKALNLSSFLNNYKVGIIRDAHTLSREASNALLKTLEEPKKKVTIILLTSKISQILPTIISRSQTINFYPASSQAIYDYLVESYGADRIKAKQVARLSLGLPALALKLLQDDSYYTSLIDKASLFLGFFNQTSSDKFSSLDEYWDKKFFGQVAKEKALELFAVWDLVLRDLLLTSQGQADLIAFEALRDKFPADIDKDKIISALDFSDKAREYLEANVSAKAVMEEFLIKL
ncbi:MAG: hypothetical protein K9M44_02185 [Candidatus Pacebacteria bacterium]|nr:hypothetical protein [Candidatus Paceibacterota bacterium]